MDNCSTYTKNIIKIKEYAQEFHHIQPIFTALDKQIKNCIIFQLKTLFNCLTVCMSNELLLFIIYFATELLSVM